jgi:RND family efflux transporter MFP subunit
VVTALLLLVAVALAWLVATRVIAALATAPRAPEARVAPVEVAPIETGTVRSVRTFSGTLRARAEFTVSPKVAGRIERLMVDISDPVERGQVVAELDDDEFALAVAQSEAELAVARANLAEAESAAEIANRVFERIQDLRQRGVASESELDVVETDRLAAQARVEVARAQLTRAGAALRTSEVRLGYTRVRADWSGGEAQRIVAIRFVDAGQMVSANDELLHIVELDPLTGVIFVTEKDYGKLSAGQPATVRTDAFPGEEFAGVIERISPVFLETSRQAHVEVKLPNPEKRLKPGMFIRATVLLDVANDATVVPTEAMTSREGRTGVFLVSDDGASVSWRPVEVGIREDQRVQVIGAALSGRVVTLGQHLIDDGSSITIPEDGDPGPAR